MSVATPTDLLARLLDYVQHLVRLPEQAQLSVKDYGKFFYPESKLREHSGIEFEGSDDHGTRWLRIERLQREDPPTISDDLRPWVKTHRNVFREPELLETCTVTVPVKDARAWVKDDTIAKEDILSTKKSKEGESAEVQLSLKKFPKIRRAFRYYVNGPFRKWAEAERPRRETIKIYDDFFKLHQTVQGGALGSPLELVWGIGMASWKTPVGTIKHPLIENLMEIDVDPASHAIVVRPRESSEPRVFLKAFAGIENPGVAALQEKAREHFESVEEFSPFSTKSYEPLLKTAATLLSSTGQYVGRNEELPPASEALRVSGRWSIYARPRSENLFIEDLERLKRVVLDTPFEDLPEATRRFAEPPSAAPAYVPRRVQLSVTEDSTETPADESANAPFLSEDQLFFPKEYNDAQVNIVQQLERSEGVVVQGPPGTGKTHTIANIVCHYLATGRRVLVTSQGEPALRVLRDFIPEEIRHLTISLLTKDREGMQQLETAATLLANEVSRLQPEAIESEIIEREEEVRSLRTRLDENEREVQGWAEKQLAPVDFGGTDAQYPADLAAEIANAVASSEGSWLPDRLSADAAPSFDDDAIFRLREARRRLGDELDQIDEGVLAVDALPKIDRLLALHSAIVAGDDDDEPTEQAATLDANAPRLSTAGGVPERAEQLVRDLHALRAGLEALDPHDWVRRLYHTWVESGLDAPQTDLFVRLLPDIDRLSAARRKFQVAPMRVPDLGDHTDEVIEALRRGAQGDRPFAMWSMGKHDVKALVAEIRVDGHPPESAEEWQTVIDYLEYRAAVAQFVERWNGIAADFGLADLRDQGDNTVRWGEKVQRDIEAVRTLVAERVTPVQEGFDAVFEKASLDDGFDGVAACVDVDALDAAIVAIQNQLDQGRAARARRERDGIVEQVSTLPGALAPALARFVGEAVGDHDRDLEFVREGWQELVDEVNRRIARSVDFATVREVTQAIEDSGAPRWAEAARREPAGENDVWTRAEWREEWDRRCAEAHLRSIDGRRRIPELSRQRREIEIELKAKLQELVRLRTFLGLFINMTDRAKSALVRFTAAVRHIGPGDGRVRARRYRRDAREAMRECYSAVPCWIMPIWRVSETLPAEPGSFDLVIVDEASQSDITALPALIRGKKILVVGDDKQVSPTAPFVEEQRLLNLRDQYLSGQPFIDLLMPGSSLYDLTNAVFPGRRVMLNEHFRCVESIIRFSFQFYPEKIIPVRIPKASERLVPPLVDLYVPHGERDARKVNRAEAEVIVDEIEALVRNPEYEGRSIGVVSLIGAKQAQYVQNLLLRRIGQEAYLRHRIECGDSATFQGRERDIIFLSMVASPGRSAAQTSVIYEQRFNVALSRARDRMVLVRSVEVSALNPNDLKAKVIGHFSGGPEMDGEGAVDAVDLCETDLERAVCEALVDAGYRVTPRVTVGDFTIDLVVEGDEDRRLALQLDGDRPTSLEEWLDDWAHQKVLERVGWHFWRCWRSSWELDPESCREELLSTLAAMEIEPIGGAEIGAASCEQRTIESAIGDDDIPLVTLDDDFDIGEPEVAKVGDKVMVNFNDDRVRYMTLIVTEDQHAPQHGFFVQGDPVAEALLGASVDEEIELPFEEGPRVVTIVRIEKSDGIPTLS